MNVGELGVSLRNMVLRIVVFLTLIVNLIFITYTLLDPVSLYALLVYLAVLFLLVALLEQTLIRDEDVRDALSTSIYPAQLRTPMRVAFLSFVGAWLLRWFVTQLFFDADLLFDNAFVGQLILVPLVLFALSIDCLFEITPVQRHYVITLLLLVELMTLFFPTRAWAPQEAGHAGTALRDMLYFASILWRDYKQPSNVYANLSAEAAQHLDIRPLNQHLFDMENGTIEPTNYERRRARVASIIDAHDRVSSDGVRSREFVALSAWILVTPLFIAVLLFPLALASILYSDRKRQQHRRVVDTTEVHKAHQPPPPPALVAPEPEPPATHVFVQRGRARAVTALGPPLSTPPVSVNTAIPAPQPSTTTSAPTTTVVNVKY